MPRCRERRSHRLERREVERELREKFRLAVRGSVLECDVPPLHVSCLAQPLHECVPVGWWWWRRIGRGRDGEVTDPVVCGLLCSRCERPGDGGTSNHFDE